MLRRSIVHAFLSVLLLLTQQIGMTHVYSHWQKATTQSTAQLSRADHAEHRKGQAAHKVCAECVSVAHMAMAVNSTPPSFASSTLSTGAVISPATLSACERTTCVFQSRAPPLA
jgi:hypothetical protein